MQTDTYWNDECVQAAQPGRSLDRSNQDGEVPMGRDRLSPNAKLHKMALISDETEMQLRHRIS